MMLPVRHYSQNISGLLVLGVQCESVGAAVRQLGHHYEWLSTSWEQHA